MAKVLIAEDDNLMRWSLEKYLTQHGHMVNSVGSGTAAIQAAESDEFRVVITDYAMPEPHGLDVLRRIKAMIPQTHVIVITGYATPQMERLARNIGAFDFFEKPFQFAGLKHAVDRAVVTPERRRGPRGCCGQCEWASPCGGTG